MSTPLLSAEKVQYSALIDVLFEGADLETITARQIRKALAAELGKDISSQKEAVRALITERFIIATKGKSFSSDVPEISFSESKTQRRDGNFTIKQGTKKRKLQNTPQSHNTHLEDSPTAVVGREDALNSPISKELKVEKCAGMLKAEEDESSRATKRMAKGTKPQKGAANRKSSTKTNLRVGASDDNKMEDVITQAEEKGEVKKKGGFHKQYNLSEPLADLLRQSTLSRPQVVKSIWAYIKANNLQDPNDRRQIICDERMQLIFKQDRIHMFTMNKILGNELFDMEEG